MVSEDPHSSHPPSLELDGSADPSEEPKLERRQLPLWARWVVSLSVAVVLLIALILFVNSHDTDRPVADNAQVTAESNREAAALVAEEQAPRVSALRPGAAPARAIEAVVAAFMRRMIDAGTFEGPLTRTRCHAAGPPRQSRQAFACDAIAASVTYPFLGVVDGRAKQVTYCRHDPPSPTGTVPVSRRCRA